MTIIGKPAVDLVLVSPLIIITVTHSPVTFLDIRIMDILVFYTHNHEEDSYTREARRLIA